jgi:hypothetical protein
MGWSGWRESATRGVLVAGRAYDCSGLTRARVVALCEAVDAIAERSAAPIVAVPADVDLTDEASADDEPVYCRVFVGVLVAEGGTFEPLPVTRDAMLAGLHGARSVPGAVWAEVSAAYREAGGQQASEDDLVVRLGCTGGLPEAKLVFGQLGAEDAALGGTFLHGQAQDQRPHEVGVHGLVVAVCSYDVSADPIDVGDAAHAARVAASPKGSYYLIAQHD